MQAKDLQFNVYFKIYEIFVLQSGDLVVILVGNSLTITKSPRNPYTLVLIHTS